VDVPLGEVRRLPVTGARTTTGTFSVTKAFATKYAADAAYEYEYAPLGALSGLCASTWPGQVPKAGNLVRLETCGVYSNSIWVGSRKPTTTIPLAAPVDVVKGVDYYVVINAASSPYAPLVLTYPAGYPSNTPSPLVNVEPLNEYATTGPVIDDQQWTYQVGTVNFPPKKS